MTITNDMNKAMQYYIDRLKSGPMNDKIIQNSINTRFNVSAAAVRTKMIEDGVIRMTVGDYDHKRMRNILMVSLVDESKVKFVKEHVSKPVTSIVIETHWPEGWPKSHGNAFDWQKTAKGLFSKAELASMQAKIKSNPAFSSGGIHVYSKA